MTQGKIEVFFLGTNGWYDTKTGNTICTLVTTPEAVVVLDAGNGLYKLDHYLTPDEWRPVYLFLSHFHLDHIVGLHTLAKFTLPGGLTLCCPTGGRNILKAFVNAPFTVPFEQLPYPVHLFEFPEEAATLPFSVEARPLLHAGLTLGFRLELAGRIIAYCPDTGYCENAVALGRNADLLITECAYKTGQSSASWPHLNPETAGRIAREAGAKRLALTHFDARIYQTLPERKEAEEAARKEFPETFAATDGMRIEI